MNREGRSQSRVITFPPCPAPRFNNNCSTPSKSLPKRNESTPPESPYKGLTTWPEKITHIKKHIADLREMIANE